MQCRNPTTSLSTWIWPSHSPPKPGSLLLGSQGWHIGRKPPRIGHFERPGFVSAGAALLLAFILPLPVFNCLTRVGVFMGAAAHMEHVFDLKKHEG